MFTRPSGFFSILLGVQGSHVALIEFGRAAYKRIYGAS